MFHFVQHLSSRCNREGSSHNWLVPLGDVYRDKSQMWSRTGVANNPLFWCSGLRWAKSVVPCWVTILLGKWNLELSAAQEDPTSPEAKFIQAFLCGLQSSRFIHNHTPSPFLLVSSFHYEVVYLNVKTWHHFICGLYLCIGLVYCVCHSVEMQSRNTSSQVFGTWQAPHWN